MKASLSLALALALAVLACGAPADDVASLPAQMAWSSAAIDRDDRILTL